MAKALSGRESKRLSARLKSSGSLAPRPHEEAAQAQTMNRIAGYFPIITLTGRWSSVGQSNRLLPKHKVKKIFPTPLSPLKIHILLPVQSLSATDSGGLVNASDLAGACLLSLAETP